MLYPDELLAVIRIVIGRMIQGNLSANTLKCFPSHKNLSGYCKKAPKSGNSKIKIALQVVDLIRYF